MRIHRDPSYIPEDARGATAALGNFDGVHLGHQAILDIAARAADAPLGVVTFEPHPREVFQPDAPPFRLMNAAARAHRLASLGVAHLYELPFDSALSALTPEEFVDDILLGALGLAHVTVGADFRFGKGRAGDATVLSRLTAARGIGCTVAELVKTDGIEASSTAIREALSEGRPDDAARMLGHSHRIEGPVIPGDRRGRTLGYPTANMALTGLHPPMFGVYATRARVLTGPYLGDYPAISSIGTRPMFGENLPNIETMLFDFAGDLYGETLSVSLVAFLRPEETFESVEALIDQMDRDSAKARAILAQ